MTRMTLPLALEPRAVTLHMTLRQAVLLRLTATAGYQQLRGETDDPDDVAAFRDVLKRLGQEVHEAGEVDDGCHPECTTCGPTGGTP